MVAARSFTTTRALSRMFLKVVAASVLLGETWGAQNCERLKTSLTYTQEEAPRDLSGVLPVVVERINQLLEGVVDVEVEWTGADLHGRVGEHIVQCKVTRLASVLKGDELDIFTDDEGREVATQCFHIPFSILDTNECLLPSGHPMRHQCHESTICVNTIGAYECLCPRLGGGIGSPGTADDGFWEDLDSQERGPWEVSFITPSRTSCPGQASTHGCCPERVHTKDGSACRAAFRCPRDPCAVPGGRNDCASSAKCVRKESPLEIPDHFCQCPEGLMGNGRKCRPGIDPKPVPKVMFDGKTPTEETIKNNYYCDCTRPVVDACTGFPPCKEKHEICVVTTGNKPMCGCKPGYVKHEKYGCVDESPPLLRLKNDPNGDQILRLSQGDVYKEDAVDIQDENAEEYLRSLKIAYSRPLPQGCLTKIGEFHVNYTVATPWTSPPYVRITRRVIIEDIDECGLDPAKYEKSCPELVPHCDTAAGAACVNTIGSYSCQCPKHTSGDGFQKGLSYAEGDAPQGFRGGTGCVDTSVPVIKLLGPNPKVFNVCECGGISGIMGSKGEKDAQLKASQQQYYSDDIKKLIRSTAGAELCATHAKPRPNASECVSAYDDTYRGRIDLSREVVVGDPVKKSALHWSVPYDVKDEAGNKATTVWRDVIVQEVDLVDVETKIRKEVTQHQKVEIQRAVDKALEEERRKRSQPTTRTRRASEPTKPCPECPKCDCSGEFDVSMCEGVCEVQTEPCPINLDSALVRTMLWLEGFFPPSAIPIMIFCGLVACSIVFLRWTMTLIFAPQVSQRNNYYAMVERERAMQNAVQYYHTDARDGGTSVGGMQRPPRASLSTGNGFLTPQSQREGLFSPPSYRSGGSLGTPQGDDYVRESIYASPSIITPSKSGDGVRRRSAPYTR